MTNPNIVNVGLIRLHNNLTSKITTVFKPLLYNPASSNQILRLDGLLVTNTSDTNATVDVDLVRSTVGYSLAKEIVVPAYSSMIIGDKDYPIYMKETDAIRARSGTADVLHVTTNFSEIGETVSTDIYTLDENHHPASLDIFSWSGTGANSATITRDTSTGKSPFGGDPLKMAVTGNDPLLSTYNGAQWNIAPAVSGQTWLVKVWVKASTATTGQIFIFGVNSSGGFIGNAGTAFSAGGFAVGTAWSEVSFSFTFSDPNVAFIQTRLAGPDTGGTGIDIWWDNLQVYRTA